MDPVALAVALTIITVIAGVAALVCGYLKRCFDHIEYLHDTQAAHEQLIDALTMALSLHLAGEHVELTEMTEDGTPIRKDWKEE